MSKKLTRRDTLGILAAGASSTALPAMAFTSAPILDGAVRANDLPNIDQRLPLEPRVINTRALGGRPGRQGGELRILIGSQRDIRLMPFFGYSRLVGYDRDLNLIPDILARFEVVDQSIFTFHLRPGHRWSDGHPFTTEDLRYAWEDVMMHERLPGVPVELRPDDTLPLVEVIDELTIRYSWPFPNPEFLPELAAPNPPRIVMPAHYMKQFHADFADAASLDAAVEAHRVDDWRALHTRLSRPNRPANPNLPTLEPWRPRTEPPAQQFIFERNPFFHRVDENGVQLPYVDTIKLNVSSYEIIPAKAAAGESDLQATTISFSHYTVLKDAENRFPINVSLWRGSQGSRLALYPNMTCIDETWRAMFRDVRVRRALSLAINRNEINQALFYGLCNASANTILPDSPLYRREYASAWARHDPDEANALLDAAGFTPAGLDGQRRLPDGRVAGILVETAGESTVETDVLELIRDHFQRVGLALWTRSSQRDIFRSRVLAGEVLMSVWAGYDNALVTSDMPPVEFAPTAPDDLQWPAWGAWYLSGETQGQAPELPEAIRLVELLRQWRSATTDDERTDVWHQMLAIHADQVFSIGTVNQAPQPILRARDLRNVPEDAIFGYAPTSMLGVYNPDIFWRDTEA